MIPKNFFPALRLLPVLAALLLSLGFVPAAAAADQDSGQLFATMEVPSGVKQADVHNIVQRALTARQWTILEKNPGRVVGTLKHRGKEAIVTFIYDGAQVQLFWKGWEVDKNGTRGKTEEPTRWLKNLQKDVSSFMLEKATLG